MNPSRSADCDDGEAGGRGFHRAEPEAIPLWYAIRVKANREQVTQRSLAGRGYETFLPAYATTMKGELRPRPLFPGYVFSRFDVRHRLPILTSPGVVGIVGFGKSLTPLDEAEVAAIRSMVNTDARIYPWPYLKEGQRVRVVKGALTGLEGIVSQTPRGLRVVTSITLLQRSVAVEIERSLIEPV